MLKPKKDVRVIVVGAGLAGLSAARELIKSGFDKTIILEASERLGGRINSTFFEDVYCELGAKWIPMDLSKYSTYELINHTSHLRPQIVQLSKNFGANDEQQNIAKFHKQINLHFKDIYCKINKTNYTDNHQYIENVQTYLNTETDNIIRWIDSHYERKLACFMFSNWLRECCRCFGSYLQCLNIDHMINWIRRSINQIYLPTGMDTIVLSLASNFNTNQIKLAHPVGLIKWFDPFDLKKKTVSCLDGSCFYADHIICTLPLGVLKNFSKYLFFPNLPEKKWNSIKKVGFSRPIKMFFAYKKYITTWFVPNTSLQYSNDYNKLNWTNQIIEISKNSSSQKVLEIVIGGSFTEEIEKLSDTEIVLDFTVLLRKSIKNSSVPYPVSLIRSKWISDACFFGGKPFISTRSTVDDAEELGTPLGDALALLFAGDATILNGFGSIDGARKSGLREAHRIIDYYSKMF